MGCTYCFAKARGGFRGDERVQFASPQAFRKRLQRASEGRAKGAFEEFLQQRVPIQLGGMTDPFSRSSVKNGTLSGILEVLSEFDYPTLISTKARLQDVLAHLPCLAKGNFYVRVSIAASNFDKAFVEPGTPSQSETFEILSMLSSAGLATCLRIQPIFPNAEEQALNLGLAAKKAGVKAVSLEYLKVPEDRKTSQYRMLDELFCGELRGTFQREGMSSDGREFSLCLERRSNNLKRLKRALNQQGIRVGVAENELLHYGDLAGCCNGGSEFLRRASDFRYNMIGLLRNREPRDLNIDELSKFWRPKAPVGRHFNSHSRFGLRGEDATWENFFKIRWNDLTSRFNPTHFDGVSFSGDFDQFGNPIYKFVPDADWDAINLNTQVALTE